MAEALKGVADAMRAKGGVECRTAAWDGERVEFVRGKDLVKWVAANPDACSRFCSAGAAPEEQGRQLGQALLRTGLLRRAERRYKKPPPGSKLIKFPKKLAGPEPGTANTFAAEAFFAWTYDRPTSPWTYVWAGLAALGVLGVCLFPMAPYAVKIAVVYASSALLTVLVGTLLARASLAGATWMLTGSALWLLPNVLQEVPFSELLKPLYAVERPAEGSRWGSHPAVRALAALSVGALLFVLKTHGPKKAAVVEDALKYRDDIFTFLNMHRDYKGLTNGTDNTTAADAASGGDSGGSGGAEGEKAEL